MVEHTFLTNKWQRPRINTSMKFGSQYGCGEQLICQIFITLFSFNTAAKKEKKKKKRIVMDIQSLTMEALCGIARILINLCAGVHTLVHARQFQLESQSVP